MSETNNQAAQTDLKAVTQAYLDAFDAQDLDRCMAFFTDDAIVDFQMAKYQGRQAITDWHKDRFAANLKMVRLDSITVKGDTVQVDGVAKSKRLEAWKVKAVTGRITMTFDENGKIKTGKLAARMTNPFNMMRGE
jgi:ketosteroid isomerase-like protein